VLEGRALAAFLGRDAGINVDIDQLPTMALESAGDVTFLRIQAESIDLVFHRNTPVTGSTQGW
jgi:hypothetical protein